MIQSATQIGSLHIQFPQKLAHFAIDKPNIAALLCLIIGYSQTYTFTYFVRLN